MAMLDSLRNMLAQYHVGHRAGARGGSAFSAGRASRRSRDARTRHCGGDAVGPDAAVRADDLHLFANGSADQKAGMLNALLSALSPDQRAQLTALLPGAGSGAAAISGNQAAAVPAETVAAVAQKAEQHNPAIIDTMSSFYAQHPTLVKTLGTAAMMIALRKIGERQA